jgi:peptidoglycan-associated lipoprotein
MINKCALVAVTASLALAVGCASKKKASDSDAGAAPAIDSTPMSFDVAGSDSGKIAGLETIHFDYDKATLSSEAKKLIKGNAEWMKSNANVKIQIEGHCDARGSIEYNLSLGERRAQAVKNYMTALGVPASRLSIISYGKEKPIATGDSEADYAKNRRANFVPLQ